jgi:hypothetical protein
MTFSGTWAIVSSPDFYDDYLSEEVDPYVKLRQSGKRDLEKNNLPRLRVNSNIPSRQSV